MRPIDDMTRSGCNASTTTVEKLKYESMDSYLALLREMGKKVGKDLELWKADIDSAFRRIPVMPSRHEFAYIVFKTQSGCKIAKHLGLPFGAVSSVHHWERIGMPAKNSW